MNPIDKILPRIKGAKPRGNGWEAPCPAHEDKNPSLSIHVGVDGRVLVNCHAGCSAAAIVAAIGLHLRDLMPPCIDSRPRAGRATLQVSGDDTPRRATESKVVSASAVSPPERNYATAREAAAVWDRQFGQRAGVWTYTDANGSPVGLVMRYDRGIGDDGKPDKTFRPVSRNGDGWTIKAMPAPRPLYRLPDLASAPVVFITEGEKAADAARSIGLITTTCAGGAKATKQSDWTPLAGKTCIILPDHDEPGRKFADDLASMLDKLTPRPMVKIVELPLTKKKDDIVEFIAARRAAGMDDAAIKAEIETLATSVELVESEAPAVISDSYKPFPVDALPLPIRTFVIHASRAMGCDESYIALPLLAGMAAAIGTTRVIQIKRDWSEPAILWTAIVGPSGTLKSPAIAAALHPIRKRQAEALQAYRHEHEEHKTAEIHYQAVLADWRRSGRTKGQEQPQAPAPPVCVRYTCGDVTIEALADRLKDAPRGLLLMRDELSGWLRSFDAYKSGKGADAAHWLALFGARDLLIDRKSTERATTYVSSAAVSITGGIQPEILRDSLGKEHFYNGMASRILLAMPPVKAKRWTDAEIDSAVEQRLDVVWGRLLDLLHNTHDDGSVSPVPVPLSADGKQAFKQFYNDHNAEQENLVGHEAAAWSKLEGYVARLALVIHFIRWAATDITLSDGDAVDAESVDAAVELVRWFGHEARRVYTALVESEDGRDRRQLVELIRRKGGAMAPRDLQRTCRRFASSGAAELALDELAGLGHGRWEYLPPGPRGGASKRVFRLIDPADTTPRGETADTADADTTTRGAIENEGYVSVGAVNGERNGGFVGAHAASNGDGEAINPDALPAAWRERWEERAGILEESNMDRAEAEQLALADIVQAMDRKAAPDA